LIPATGEPITLNPLTSEEPLVLAASQTLQESVRWKLELSDDAGRKNRQPVEFVIDVVRNARPELKLVFPKRDLKVSPLQEVSLESEVADDFGVLRWGLEYEMTGRQKETITFGEQLAASEKQQGQRVIALEDLQAKADELLAWHVWAEDLGPDGKVRRTTSDIFFAEVSPFEEIFREQSADSGEGQPAENQPNPVEETAGKQKEIVTAIWNLRRREEALLSPSSQYAADVQAIAEAQEKLLASLPEMKAKLQSPDASVVVTEIEQHMQAALTALTAATASKALPPLNEALPAAQAAYQSLLKLRARENRVMKSKSAKSSSSSGSQQSAAGQELDQLEMNQDEQRYETKKSAADAQQTPAQKEREQIMNRLRELAKRQEDTNQKVKELQAALDAAKTAEQQQQLERQLKRLRDEQRDVLRDVDQLKNKVEKPEHNQPLAEASRQLQETRENARQASDALEKGQTQQALAAGTRTENALDKLGEDFRKQNASQVANEVRELVERAQQIDERQQKISQQLTDPAKEQPPRATTGGLRAQKASPTAPELSEQLAGQKKELAEVLEKAKALTERVEGNEPLLSKQLYDTVRQAHQKQTQRAVEIMKQLTDSHLPAEAKKLAPQAEQGVKQLRAGIEKAAEGVLGNDVESLRRAKQEVDRLAQALSAEMAGPQAANENNSAEKPNPAGQPQPAAGKTPNEKQPAEKAESGKAGEASSQPKPPSNQPGNSPGSESKSPESESGEGKLPAGKSGEGKSGEGKSGEAPQPGSAKESPGKAPSGDQPQQSSQASQQQGTQPSGGVLTGGDWREWSDALRNVEEFVPGTRLRADAARVREQAQAMRAEFKRHSKAPNWDLVRETIYEPLMELQRQLDEELQRRSSPDAAVPLDRDPVPDKFGEAVKRYYERLGSGQ
jgi:hypothetical protein